MTGPSRLSVRRASSHDARLLFDWATDPATRAASFSSAAITWDDHVAWLSRKLSDPRCHFYIVELEGRTPVATVRFDATGASADVSVTVAPAARGKRLSAPAITAAVSTLLGATDLREIRAFIKPGNVASLRSFEQAGFEEVLPPRADARCFVHSRPSTPG